MTLIIGPSGIVLDIEPSVASGLVDGGHARYVTVSAEESTVPDGGDEPDSTEPDVDSDVQGTEDGPSGIVLGEKPKGNAGLPEWAAFATANGQSVDGLSRDEIRALFKE